MTTFLAATGKEIQVAFDDFHPRFPIVYELFKEGIFRAIRSGKKKISAKTLLGHIRWERFLITDDAATYVDRDGKTCKFRINDAYTSRYARLFAKEYPEHAEIFNYKELRA